MSRIIADTVATYARSRSNQAMQSNDRDDVVEIIDLNSTTLTDEPIAMTQAANFASSLQHISQSSMTRKKSAALAIHQKIVESWAINCV